MAQPKIFVTGATGFIGRNLVRRLTDAGCAVVCLVRKSAKSDFLREMPGVTVVYGEMSDEAVLEECIRGAETVYHIAGCVTALSLADMLRVNVGYTEKVAKACARQPRPPVLVYVSSLSAAGPARKRRPHVESDVPAPISQYGTSKLAAERALRKYADRVPITVVRPPIVFGPHDIHFRCWMENVRRLGIFFIPVYRPYYFSFVYSEDLVRMLLLAGERGERLPAESEVTPATDPGQGIYYAGYAKHISYLQLGRYMADAVGRRWVLTLSSTPIIFGLIAACGHVLGKFRRTVPLLNPDKFRESMAGQWICSAEKARRQLGFVPECTIEEALRVTAESYHSPVNSKIT